MMFAVVEKDTQEFVRFLTPLAATALLAVRRGTASPEMRKIYDRVVNPVRDEKRWISCGCREGAVIALRRQDTGWVTTFNMHKAPVPHAPGCVFGRREDWASEETSDDFLDPLQGDGLFLPDPGAEPRDPGTEWPSTRRRAASLAYILKTLMQAAGLHTLEATDRLASPGEWLLEVRRAAERFHIAPRVRVSELLFTDPESWCGGEVRERLDAIEPHWPGRRRPFALLCWIAHDVSNCEINRENRKAGYVRVSSEVVGPEVFGNRVSGPYLFLGVVARSDDRKTWECREAYAQPIVAPECPIPVDSDYERRALQSLRQLVPDLLNDRELIAALGGVVRAELEKPLFPFEVFGGPCLPDVLVTVTRPRGHGHNPGGQGHPPRNGPFDDRDKARYVIEIMGFDDPKYEKDKEVTHPRMRRLGRVIRMEGRLFDSRYNEDRQRERITRQIAKDLAWRWEAE